MLLLQRGKYDLACQIRSCSTLAQRRYRNERFTAFIKCYCVVPVIVFVSLSFLVSSCFGSDWPQWRGPDFNGASAETGLPVQWSRTDNIAWRIDLPGPSAATPIVSGDHVFISSSDPAQDMLLALCVDRKTGKVLWQKEIARGQRRESYSNYASPSPATDGNVILFFYGNGDLVAFDFSGNRLWSKNVQEEYGPFAFNWSFSSSPLLFRDKLYLQVLQRDVPVDGRGFTDRKNESYLLAMEPETGNVLWRALRPSEAKMESREAFSTPVPFTHQGRTELLLVGGDDLTGHDPETGKELWRWGTWNPSRIGHWRLVPSPISGAGVILACAPKQDPIYAVRAGLNGQLDDTALAWTSADTKVLTSDVPTPAFYDGDFFVLSDLRKTLSRVNPRTGKTKWQLRTPGLKKYEASPLVADGKIYLINFIADVVVVDAGTGKILHQVSMDDPSDDPVRSSVVVAHGNLFVRTNSSLYCIGK